MMGAPRIAAVVRSDNGGLGSLSRLFDAGLGFYRRLALNRLPNEQGDFCREPDERTRLVGDSITDADARWLCDGADAVISFETWYGDTVPRMARQMGVRTVLTPNYECCVLDSPELRYTDLAICPTDLDLDEARDNTPGLAAAKKIMLPMPCDVERIPFRRRERALVFVHHYGHQGEGRNGTCEVIHAWQHVKSPARLILLGQCDPPGMFPDDERIELQRVNPPNYWELWQGEGDVYLHATKWDSLSLPIQESLTSGMPVVTARWWPHCDDERPGYLPASIQSLAVPVARTTRSRMCREFTAHHVTAKDIAAVVDRLYGQAIGAESDDARAWAEGRSWDKMRGAWLEAIGEMLL